MGDDYVYPIKPLPQKKRYGGNAALDAQTPVTAPDPYPVASTIPADDPLGGGDYGGGGGGLPDGTVGDLLRHNGYNWIPISPPTGDLGINSSLLQNSQYGYSWITAEQQNEIIYYGGPLENFQWKTLPASPYEGTFVLGVVDGELQWMGTENCEPDA